MKKILPWLIVGLVFRLFLVTSYAHPDLRGYNFGAYLISEKGQLLHFYDYLSKLPPQNQLVRLYRADLFIYPPLAYITPAVFMKILSPIYPWSTFLQYIYDDSLATSFPQFALMLLLLKTPFLVADFVCLYLISKLLEPKQKFLGQIIWLFNPVTVYASYLVGQFDIFIAMFILLSLVYMQRKKYTISAMLLGIAAAYKPFPLFFLFFLPGSKVKNLIAGVLTYGLIILPFVVSPGFRQYALFAPQTQKLSFAQIAVSTDQYISLFFAGLAVLAWFNLRKPESMPVWGWMASVSLLFYSLSNFHPQWLVWITPFLTVFFLTKTRTRFPIVALLLIYFAIVLTFEPSLNFAIIGSQFSLSSFLDKLHQLETVTSLLRSAFAATAIYLVYLFTEKYEKQP